NAIDRLLGSGSLIVETAGQRGRVVLSCMPHAHRVQETLAELSAPYRPRGRPDY
ncbi:PH domain-containing protein, partial [Frankia sp. AvcI1]